MSLFELSQAEERRRARWRVRASIVVVTLAVLVSGLILWRDLRDDRPHAEVGSITATQSDFGPTWRRTVLVPGTRYDVGAAVSDDVTRDAIVHTRQAPDDGTFVGLSITPSEQPGPSVPGDASSGSRTDVVGPRFVLIADGRRYGLPADTNAGARSVGAAEPSDVPFSGWIAVIGSGARLTLETSWEGRVQRLDLRTGRRDAGDFAAVYRQRGTGVPVAATASCGSGTWTPGWRAGPGVAPACAYRADRLPWTPGQGWAKAGRQWLLLTVTTATPTYAIHRVGGRDLPYAYTGLNDSAEQAYDASDSPDRVDGRAPVFLRQLDDGNSAQQVFDIAGTARPTAVITVEAGLRARTAAGASDSRTSAAVRWTVPLDD